MKTRLVEPDSDAAKLALQTIHRCATPNGLYASGPPDGYTMVFSRDAMITLLGACATGDETVQIQFKKSLLTLGKHQSKTGQIPNAVDLWDKKRPKYVSFATLDSTLWWLIGLHHYAKRYSDSKLLPQNKIRIEKAFFWLECLDTGEDSMPEQQSTSDWQDAFPHKYGHVLNTQALYYWALSLYGRKKEAALLRKTVNGGRRKDWCLWDAKRGYYLPWAWKDHDGYRETEHWFDSLGNLLAILTGLADQRQTNSILGFIAKHSLNKPFPLRCIHPPIRSQSGEWKDYFNACAAKEPGDYLNGGIWPFIGGLYVVALVKMKQFKEAEFELLQLEKANLLDFHHLFPEWIRPSNSEAFGVDQAWSAGGFLWAMEAVCTKKAFLFD